MKRLYLILAILLIPALVYAYTVGTPPNMVPANWMAYAVDPGATDSGVTSTSQVTLKNLVTDIGTTKKATIIFPHTGSGTTTQYTIGTALDLSSYSNITFQIENGAQLYVSDGVSGVTFPSQGNIKAQPNQQIMSGTSLFFANAGGTASVRWFGANPDGSGDDNTSLQTALNSVKGGGDLLIPSGTSYYTTSATLISGNTNTKIIFEKGAEIWVSGVSTTLLRLAAGYQTVDGGTFRGYGLFNTKSSIPAGTEAVALISGLSDYATIKNCTLKNGEQAMVAITGDYATIENNLFIGGPYFPTLASFGSTVYQAILFQWYADKGIVKGNRITAGDDGGKPVEGLLCQRSRDMLITGNHFFADYDHAIYAYLDGSVVSDNVVREGAIKVNMETYVTSDRGNTITGNMIDISGSTGILSGDAGIILVDPRWTIVSNNVIRNAQDAGIQISLSTGVVTQNTISNNIIDGVEPSGGVHAIGINIESSGITEFSFNKIIGNIISNVSIISGATDDINAGIAIHEIENNTNHIGNVISDNIITNISETAIYLRYISKSLIANNSIYNIGTALGGDSGVYLRSCWENKVVGNNIIGSNSLNYLFREMESSTSNFYAHNFGSGTTLQITGNHNSSNISSDNSVVETLSAGRTVIIGEAKTYVFDPNGSDRTITVSGTTIPKGYEFKLVNTTDGTSTLWFETAKGVVAKVSGASEFIYSGTTWFAK